jgi:hypothetical protein
LTPKKTTAADDLVDLFRPYGIPPTRLHRVVQEAATEAGWIAPWDPDAVKLKNEKPKKKAVSHARVAPSYACSLLRRRTIG